MLFKMFVESLGAGPRGHPAADAPQPFEAVALSQAAWPESLKKKKFLKDVP